MRADEAFEQATLAGGGHHQSELHDAGDGDADRRTYGRIRKQERDEQEADHHQVKDHGIKSRRRKQAMRVEGAAVERHQRDAQEIGEGDPRQDDGVVELGGIVFEAMGKHPDELRREEERQREKHDLRSEQDREDLARKGLGLAGALGFQHPCIGGYVGRVECALAKDRPEMVGQAERHEEGVRQSASAEDGAEQDVAKKAGGPRHEGQAADREEMPVHQFRLSRSSCTRPAERISSPAVTGNLADNR